MNDAPRTLDAKVARLIQAKGWTQQTFAREAGLHRLTVANIIHGKGRRLHQATVEAIAAAFGMTAFELRTEPIERLLLRVSPSSPVDEPRRAHLLAMLRPEFQAWFDANPDQLRGMTLEEIDEVLSFQEDSETLTAFEIAPFFVRLDRRRRLVAKVIAIAGTAQVDLLESMVDLLFEKIRPYG